jgi:hypothetical protein
MRIEFAMSNPYQPPISQAHDKFANPVWSRLLDNFHWYFVAFIVGTFFVPERFEHLVRWALIGMLIVSIIFAMLLRTLIRRTKLFVPLNSQMLRKQGRAYQQAIVSFQHNERLLYDDVVFMLRSDDEVTCETVADFIDRDDAAAIQRAHHCRVVFDSLVSQSAEFADAVKGRRLRVSILADASSNARQLCQYTDEKLSWCG